MLSGELDWVVMKALEKDRTRRYETANGLARDIQRYLANEVVEARPPSTAYRLRKFASNHKPALITATTIVLLLVAGIVGTTLGLIRAERLRLLAEKAAAEARKARDSEAEQRKLAEQLDANERMHNLAYKYSADGKWSLALPLFDELLRQSQAKNGANHPSTVWNASYLSSAYLGTGKWDAALPLAKQAYETARTMWGDDSRNTKYLLDRLTNVYVNAGAYQAWFGKHKELAETCASALEFAKGTTDPRTADRLSKICWLLPTPDQAQRKSALALARTAVELGEKDPYFRWFQMGQGIAEYRTGHFAEADAALVAAADALKDISLVSATCGLYRAMSLFRQGKEDEALALAIESASKMEPLPKDESAPLSETANPNDLILWLAYKEAKALINFETAPVVSAP
jgi:tetratricopeptide (TPR) repeat protein